MKVIAIAALFFFTSCAATKFYPIKGTYTQGPIEVPTSKSFDDTWNSLVDLFAQKGLPIKLIDRSSGLIVSERTEMTYTNEDLTGKIVNPKAYVVVPSEKNPLTGTIDPVASPYKVSGEWNVRIKQTPSGIVINVNLNNLSYPNPGPYGSSTIVQLPSYSSTGVFERMIADYIK